MLNDDFISKQFEAHQLHNRKIIPYITELNLSNEKLMELPDLSEYTSLTKLNCSQNQLTRLDNIPSTVTFLNCSNNYLEELDNLPPKLETLWCYNNELTTFHYLPETLKELHCSGNPLEYKFAWTIENIRQHLAHKADYVIK